MNFFGNRIGGVGSAKLTSSPVNSNETQALRTKLGLLQDDYSKELSLQRGHKLTVQTSLAELRNQLINLEKSVAAGVHYLQNALRLERRLSTPHQKLAGSGKSNRP